MSRPSRVEKLGLMTSVAAPALSKPKEKDELLPAAIIAVSETGISLDIWGRAKPGRIIWDCIDPSLDRETLIPGRAVMVLADKEEGGRSRVTWVQPWGKGRI